MTVWPNGSKSIPRVTSEYGVRTDPISGKPSTHAGIDLIGWANNKSPMAGVVIFAAYNGGAGNEVRVRADNGDTFRIKHNARFLVSVGQRVAEGQDVGVMGTTGYSTGIHCHFETWPGGRAHVNPRTYMAVAISGGGSAGGVTTPIIEKEKRMFALVAGNPATDNGRNRWAVIYPDGSSKPIGAEVDALGTIAKAAGVPTVLVTGTQFDQLGLSNVRGPRGELVGEATVGEVDNITLDLTPLVTVLERVEAAVNKLNPPD